MPHVVCYRRAPGVPHRVTHRGLPGFGHGRGDARYRLVEDDDVAERLCDYDRNGVRYFRCLHSDDVEEALGSATEAVEAIGAGEYDDALDLLLFAEREAFDSRVTIIDAIERRNRELAEQRAGGDDGEGDTLMPEEVAPPVDEHRGAGGGSRGGA